MTRKKNKQQLLTIKIVAIAVIVLAAAILIPFKSGLLHTKVDLPKYHMTTYNKINAGQKIRPAKGSRNLQVYSTQPTNNDIVSTAPTKPNNLKHNSSAAQAAVITTANQKISVNNHVMQKNFSTAHPKPQLKESLVSIPNKPSITTSAKSSKHSRLYFGMQTGIGSTNWAGLNGKNKPDDLIPGQVLFSAPKKSDDTGMVFGAFMGYKLTPYLSIEANYMHMPDTSIQMDMSMAKAMGFYKNLPADGKIISHTEAADLTAHLRQEILNTQIYAYGMAGVGYVYRHDIMAKRGVASAVFGFGLDRNISKHISAEIDFTYMTGKDTATVDPVNYYVPFIDTLNFGVAYQI